MYMFGITIGKTKTKIEINFIESLVANNSNRLFRNKHI